MSLSDEHFYDGPSFASQSNSMYEPFEMNSKNLLKSTGKILLYAALVIGILLLIVYLVKPELLSDYMPNKLPSDTQTESMKSSMSSVDNSISNIANAENNRTPSNSQSSEMRSTNNYKQISMRSNLPHGIPLSSISRFSPYQHTITPETLMTETDSGYDALNDYRYKSDPTLKNKNNALVILDAPTENNLFAELHSA
jgi:cytoskeletal protein RodZ